jgi:hypothetical protein
MSKSKLFYANGSGQLGVFSDVLHEQAERLARVTVDYATACPWVLACTGTLVIAGAPGPRSDWARQTPRDPGGSDELAPPNRGVAIGDLVLVRNTFCLGHELRPLRWR